MLFLGVGTGAAGAAANATVDRLISDYTTNGGVIGSGAHAGGIINSGGFALNAIPVRVLGNNVQVVQTSTNSGNLVNRVTPADTIFFTQITSSTSPPVPPVPLANGGTANPTFNPGSTEVTTHSANWTVAYASTVTPAAGTYNCTVTHTASMT